MTARHPATGAGQPDRWHNEPESLRLRSFTPSLTVDDPSGSPALSAADVSGLQDREAFLP